jgi:hypothetical protein
MTSGIRTTIAPSLMGRGWRFTSQRTSRWDHLTWRTITYVNSDTWDTLKEAAQIQSTSGQIDFILVNGTQSLDSTEALIAEEFHNFFSKVSVQISNSILPTELSPDDFIPPNPPPPQS